MNALSVPLMKDLWYALKPSEWCRQFITPDPWQVTFLDDYSQRQLALTSRQIGKSTTVAIKIVHGTWFFPEELNLLIAPTLRQSVELIMKCKWTLNKIDPEGRHHRAKALSIELDHTGGRIVALPGGNPNNIRGFSGPRRIVVDESAFTKNALYEDAVSPMLMHGGQLILTSTANVKRGYFYDIATGNDADLGEAWSRHIVPATMSPRATPQFLETQRRRLPEYRFQAEYMCQFFDSVEGYFRQDEIDAAFTGHRRGKGMTFSDPDKKLEPGTVPALSFA